MHELLVDLWIYATVYLHHILVSFRGALHGLQTFTISAGANLFTLDEQPFIKSSFYIRYPDCDTLHTLHTLHALPPSPHTDSLDLLPNLDHEPTSSEPPVSLLQFITVLLWVSPLVYP